MLRDCTLFVQGDVELTEAASMGGFSPGGYNVNAASTTSAPCYSSLSGTNATLVVSGNLKIVGGALDSRDKGMVIHARNMDLSTRGKFKGMILTQGAITINPYPTVTSSGEEASGETLNVQGAIACLGEVLEEEDLDDPTSPPALPPRLEGLVLKSTNLVFDPKYVRAFHRFGQPRIGLWRELR